MGTFSGQTRGRYGIKLSVGATLLAALASQHHLLHMILLTSGFGGAGMSFLVVNPALRRSMLILSLVMLGITAYRALRRPPPMPGRLLIGASAVATLRFVAWSVARLGW